jgi:hypothetical protein
MVQSRQKGPDATNLVITSAGFFCAFVLNMGVQVGVKNIRFDL